MSFTPARRTLAEASALGGNGRAVSLPRMIDPRLLTDEPDATAAALAEGIEPEEPVALTDLDDELRRAGSIALLAYVDPSGSDATALGDHARVLAQRYGVPVTVGIGPRYLHSTGQLHKGGRSDIVLLVLVGEDPHDVLIPGRGHGFARLKRAQAAGDLVALRAAGRRAHRIAVDDPDLAG